MKTFDLTILYTTDVHGAMLPINFATGNSDEKGLTRLKTYLNGLSEPYLLFDNGDILQGSPLMNYWANNASDTPCPASLMMNHLGYDLICLGNHDFNYGMDILKRYTDEFHGEIVCANVLGANGLPIYRTHVVKSFPNGPKVGIIGVMTQYVPHWENPEHIRNLTFADAFQTVASIFEKLRKEVDAVIVIYHGSFERDPMTGVKIGRDTDENEAYRMAKELDIDVLLTGHQHQNINTMINGTLVMQTRDEVRSFGRVVLSFEQSATGWRVKNRIGEIMANQFASDLVAEALLIPLRNRTEDFLKRVIATTKGASLEVTDDFLARRDNHPLIKLVNDAQLAYTLADFSAASLPNSIKGLRRDITLRDLEATFIYPNTIFVVEITGATLKAAMEKSATYFALQNDEIILNPNFFSLKPEHYNYDLFSGVEYEIDLKLPDGSKVKNIFVAGKPLADHVVYQIAINNYRAAGGGDYPMYIGAKLVREYLVSIPELIEWYLSSHPDYVAEPSIYPKLIK